ncbi:acetylcholinesterase precursor [Corynespora cassiicola Philippines]|uniref:Carboxylic ester hydrolase n=1 Tax=Corynespora cassiicola Philippines TaxID=1448308 RepID=A0A2T2N5R7_CORCC|nr:acetylcholinesterase precursor [Corynespora cassiicola Philippines]
MYCPIVSPRVAALAVLLFKVVTTQSSSNSSNSLPILDFGYALHRAADFNETGGYYNFSNIRFAAPPLGNLRFRVPVPPAVDRSVVQDGLESRMCPQNYPPWMATIGWVPGYLQSGAVPNTTVEAGPSTNSSSVQPRDPSQNEDCLFLDVMAPQEIFEKAGRGYGAPVLVWIYGGGYAVGSKTSGYDPRSILNRSQTNSSEGVIFVALNYRLGAFGFLAGPSLQGNGTANAGLYDQRMALEWVQEHIHLFGGDKNRVTVMGESAGGGSIAHQLTAYGGRGPLPFQQAIIQSPGWTPNFLRSANVNSLEEARNLPTDQLMDANDRQIFASPYGSYVFGPSVDGDFVTQDPKLALSQSQFDPSVRVMIGQNSNEGLLFTAPISSDTEYLDFVRNNFPSAREGVIDHIANVLYPPVFDGSMGYRDQVGRAALTMGEGTFVCNAFALNRAYNNHSSYLFDVFPGLHAQDVEYTFYNPDVVYQGLPVLTMWGDNQTVAYVMHNYFTSFAMTGTPESQEDGLSAVATYDSNFTLTILSTEGISTGTDPAVNERCAWWQTALIL